MKQRRPQGTQDKKVDGRANRSLLLRVIFLLCMCGVVIFFPLVWKLYQLQIIDHEYYKQLANKSQTRDVTVTANRGSIYDRNGDIMAISATVYQLILSPRDVLASVKEEDYTEDGVLDEEKYHAAIKEKRELIADFLSQNYDLDHDQLMTRLEKTKSAYEVLLSELNDEDAAAVRTFISDNKLSPGLYLTPTSKRYYPNTSTASHILGFLAYGEDSGNRKVGAYGVEATYEQYLAGQAGRVVTAKNASGTEMLSSYEAYVDAQDGANLTLTIDDHIQLLAEQTLETAIDKYYIKKGGFCIVLDPDTCAVLAMASSPDFDSNDPTAIQNSDTQSELDELKEARDAAQADYDAGLSKHPDYDPDDPSATTDQSVRTEMNHLYEKLDEASKAYNTAASEAQYAQWRNKAIWDGYEPGSTFKPLVIAAALEEGVISMNDTFYCGGVSSIGGWDIHCHNRSGHGSQSLTEALENSCNVAMMTIAQRLTASRFWDYLEDYGLMEPTGIGTDLGGEGNSLFWSEDTFVSEEGLSSLAVASFGQTFKITPIRMITSFASLINGGRLLKPYIVQSATDQTGNIVYYHETDQVRQVLSESTSAKLRTMLESVVANGSGKNAYKAGYRIGGKTGTSEKRDEQTGDVICSFMGFAPADDPQVLVLLALDSPQRDSGNPKYTPGGTYISGGNIAAPICGALIADIMDYLGTEREYLNEDESAKADVVVPSVTGKSLADAQAALTERGLTWRTVGDSDTVTAQIPAAGASIPGESQVVLYMGVDAPTDTVTVPNLVGKSPSAVEHALAERGLYIRATGVANFTSATSAASQSIADGTSVPRGTVIEVQFVEDSIADNQ